MGRPVFGVENLFNPRTFRDHTLAGYPDTESGLTVLDVGSGRRRRELARWAPSSLNTAAGPVSTFDRVRAFDHIAIDRALNFRGYPVEVHVTSNDFTDYTTVSGTIPTQVFPYSRLSDGAPILTEEGAVLWRVGIQAGSAVRVVVPAMGAGLKPEFTGLYAGTWLRPQHAPVKPFSHGAVELTYKEETSPQAQVAAGEIGKRRRGTIHLKLADRAEYAQVRYHIEGLYFSRKPMWVVPDDEEAEKARLVYAPPGVHGAAIEGDWSEFQVRIPWVEHEPLIVGEVGS